MSRAKVTEQLRKPSTLAAALHKVNMILLDTGHRFTATAKGDRVRIRNSDGDKIHQARNLFDALKWFIPNGYRNLPFETLWSNVAYESQGAINIPWPHKRLHSCRVYRVSNNCKKKSLCGKYVQPLRVADMRGIRYWCSDGAGKEYKIRSRDLVNGQPDDWGF